MILVTGGLGMIGSHTAQALAELDQDVVVTAHQRAEVPDFLRDRVAVEPLDVTDLAAVLELGAQHPITDIVHLAGSVPGDDLVAFFRTETTGLLTMLEAARTWGVRRFLVASSLGSYAGRPEPLWDEELALPTVHAPHPIVAYKKAVEPIATHALAGTGVQPVVLRIGSVWGPLMDPDSPFNPIPPYVNAALRGELPQAAHADDGGDTCYAPDAGRAIALLTTTSTLRHEVYNVSSGQPYTNRELAAALQEIGAEPRIELVPGRASGPGDNPYLDIARLRADTGFAPRFDVAAAVAHYATWRADHAR